MMINITEEQLKEIVIQAHMAGQHNQTGCDPSYFEAENHWQKQVKNLGIFSVVNPVICPNCEEECEPIPLGQMCNKCHYDKM